MAIRAQVVEARRRQRADLRVEERRQLRCGAAEAELAEGRAQVLLHGLLDRLRPQPRPVPLLPQVHQLAEGPPLVVAARREAFTLLACEPLALEGFETRGRLRLGLRGRALPSPVGALEAQPPALAFLVDARHVSPCPGPSRRSSREVEKARSGSARRRECTASRLARHERRSTSERPSGSSLPHARPTSGSGVVLLCSWCRDSTRRSLI